MVQQSKPLSTQQFVPRSPLPPQVSVTEANWSREELRRWWEPGRQLVRSLRRYQAGKARGGLRGAIASKIAVLEHRFWSVVAGADVPLNCQVGGGFILPHPTGVVIHPKARFGVNCMVFQQVTIVARVEVGSHVDIGAGAKVIRCVKIGGRAKIGANAVVLHDVPSGATAVGIPARIVPADSQPPQ